MFLLRGVSIKFIQRYLSNQCHPSPKKPKHLICFKNWTSGMVRDVLESAISLKCSVGDTHNKRLKVLADSKVMILQEVNEPFLNMAVSKAATLLGAYDVNITDHLVWEQDYMGKKRVEEDTEIIDKVMKKFGQQPSLQFLFKQIFSYMADAIFVATMTHMCVQRFATQSSVPVLCMRSRTHASIQSLSTIMSVIEEFGSVKNLNLAYCGSPHPVLNSYLLLCPMLGANIKFKCCCQKTPVSPLLYKASEEMTAVTHTGLKECLSKDEVLKDASVIIAGPGNSKKVNEFKLNVKDVQSRAKCKWIFFHTGPRGEEVDDNLFFHCNSRTFNAFENFHYIAAALMSYVIKDHKF